MQKVKRTAEQGLRPIIVLKANMIQQKKILKTQKKFIQALNDSAGFLLLYSTYGILYGMQSNYDRSIMFFKRAAIFAENYTM